MKNKDTSVNQITEGVIWKQLLFFFFPIMLGTLFQQLYNTADAVVVGRFVGTRALAAVGGSTGQMVNLLVNLRWSCFRRYGHYCPLLRSKKREGIK